VASYLDARAHRGRWILRIEDLDRPREVAGSASGILSTLENFGFEWDGEVVRQFERRELYEAALKNLMARGLTFACSCSRSQLEDELRYPGTCRSSAALANAATGTRLKVDAGQISFSDRIQGMYRQDVSAAVGDIILKRRDQIFAYVLAVVVDDAAQGVTHIVRGADLLDNTPRQIHLQRLLGASQPIYAHVPVLTESDDSKLAKSRRSVNLAAAPPLQQLLAVFSLLGMKPPTALGSARIRTAWEWAFGQWDLDGVPKRLNLRVND
jgi:glutamyl-Q tRNA(Asp) synthetase